MIVPQSHPTMRGECWYINIQLAGKYPFLTDAIARTGASYDQIIQHMANMTETEWREMARMNGVTVDEFVADAERAIDAFESLYKHMATEKVVILPN